MVSRGLRPPQSIIDATNEYRAEIDVIGTFISQHCNVGLNLEVGSALLFQEFSSFCRNMNHEPITSTLFGRELTRRGYSVKKNNINFRQGLTLKPAIVALAA